MALGHGGRQYALRRRGAGMKKNRLIHRDTVTRPLTVLIVCSILLSLVRVPLVRAIACPPEWPSPDCNGIVSNGGTDWIPEMATCTTTDSNSNTAEQAIAQTLILGFNVNTPKDVITDLATKYRFGGIYPLGTTDAASKGFDKAFYDSLGAAATIPLLVSSDEEGVVTRYAYPPGSFPSAAVMATKTDSEVQEIGKTAGEVMALSGITVDLAPVLDLRDVGIAGRAFSSDPAVIAAKAGAFAAGLSGSGVRPVFKHFPGFSEATQPSNGNTDTEKVVLKGDITKNVEPYREVLKTHANGAVMLSNLYVEKLDGDNPASLSKKVVDYLRTDVGFTGLVTTDDIAVKSVTDKAGSVGKAVAGALAAGVTMPLLTLPNASTKESAEKSMDDIIAAVKDNEDAAAAVVLANATIQSFKGNTSGMPASSCCSGTDITNGDTEANTKSVFDYLTTTAKLPAVQAAGIVGNMYIESGVLPQRKQGTPSDVITTAADFLDSGSDGGWGLVQWTPGSKFINSKDPSTGAAAHTVEDADKLGVQITFVWDQLEGRTDIPEKIAGDDIKALAASTSLRDNLREAVLAFQGDKNVGGKYFGFERPADEAGSVDARLAYAVTVLDKYGSGVGSTTGGTSSTTCTSGGGLYVLPVDQKWYDEHPDWFSKDHHLHSDGSADNAADIPVPTGTSVYASASGKIIKAPNEGGYGEGVTIDVGDGVTMVYGHGLDGGTITGAKEGDTVKAGALIMHADSTGYSTGSHLHFQINVDGVAVCPQKYLVALGEGRLPPDIKSLPRTGCSSGTV